MILVFLCDSAAWLFGILFGKKLINFFKDSGILDSTCVRINKMYPFVLPGGFMLPISLIKQEIIYYDCLADKIFFFKAIVNFAVIVYGMSGKESDVGMEIFNHFFSLYHDVKVKRFSFFL